MKEIIFSFLNINRILRCHRLALGCLMAEVFIMSCSGQVAKRVATPAVGSAPTTSSSGTSTGGGSSGGAGTNINTPAEMSIPTSSATPSSTTTTGTTGPSTSTTPVASLCGASAAPQPGTPSGKTYYVSPSGSDSNDGLSIGTAWQTFANLKRMTSGDQALLKGGATFNEGLYLGPGSGINNTNEAIPIFISTFGSGKAILQTGCSGGGIFIYNTGGFEISNLELVGCTTATPIKVGVSAWSDDNKTHTHLYFNNMDIGYYNFGFQFQNAFTELSVSNSSIHDDQSTGIYFGTGVQHAYAGHNEVQNIANGYGYGIYFFAMQDGTAEYNVVHAVGGPGAGYGQGIAAQNSNNVTIQYNEVYNILKGAANDDNGIIIDADSTNTTSQYNYIHDIPNGYGVTMCEWDTSGPAYTGHSLRYNLIVNTGTGVLLMGEIAALPANANIYNNTIVSATGKKSISFSYNIGAAGIYNNAFIGVGGASIGMAIWPDTSINQQILNNGYYSPGAPYSFGYQTSGTSTSGTYAGLAAFRAAASQEGGASAPVGIEANPLLNLPTSAPTVGIAHIDSMPTILAAYQLPSNSPFVGKGMDLQGKLGINPGSHDFWCHPITNNIGN